MLYFLKNNDKVKIGYTDNPVQRISQIQTSNPDKIECLLLINGGYDEEYQLHNKFLVDRIRDNGEWFYLSKDILSFISENLYLDKRYEFGLVQGDYGSNEQLKRVRKQLGLTLQDISDRVGISIQSVKECEDRERQGTITLNTLQKIASAMGRKAEYRITE